MNFLEAIKEKAKKLNRTIVLPEAETDNRVLEAYCILNKENIARIILLGEKAKILNRADNLHILVHEQDIVEPEKSKNLEEFAGTYYELRKQKGMTMEEAEKVMRTPLYFGAMMVRKGLAHGM